MKLFSLFVFTLLIINGISQNTVIYTNIQGSWTQETPIDESDDALMQAIQFGRLKFFKSYFRVLGAAKSFQYQIVSGVNYRVRFAFTSSLDALLTIYRSLNQ